MHVELEHVSKRFGRIAALRDVTVTIPTATRTAVIGPNGSGKSTLTRVIMGMLACEGRVLLDGRSPFEHRAELAPALAYVPQVAPQLHATVREVVATVARLRDLDVAVIAEVATALGLDLDEVRRQPFRSLSGGMRQKLLAALSLSAPASLLLLDEPTSSMDPISRHRFFQLVEQLPKRPTILLSSHRLEEIRHLVDRVMFLDDGKLAWEGTATQYLLQRSSSMLEVQADGDEADGWLQQRGFRRGGTGWWTLTVRSGERRALVHELTHRLGDALHDIVVRDVESIEERTNGAPREP